ncbi:hypothetical protein [Janthinobacterium sp. 67]|uniref:hypothetical protein n=1 Tax=Janthinobacterium sp. 67 TaxID=2035207 RepID=UPI0018E263AB|nr:hypothetical protein [Janthinobacterium sp. 67]
MTDEDGVIRAAVLSKNGLIPAILAILVLCQQTELYAAFDCRKFSGWIVWQLAFQAVNSRLRQEQPGMPGFERRRQLRHGRRCHHHQQQTQARMPPFLCQCPPAHEGARLPCLCLECHALPLFNMQNYQKNIYGIMP